MRRFGPLRRLYGPALLALAMALAAAAAGEGFPSRSSSQVGPPPVGSGSHLPAEDAAEVAELCEKIGNKLGSVSVEECLAAGLEPTGARSVTGQPILAREFPALPGREPLGRVLLIGGIHGDEYSSITIVFKWLSILQQNHSGLFHWRVVPLVNPDGLFRRPAQRQNHRGVDLNRNFPSPNWFVEAEDYWVRRTSRNPRRYPGPAPLSEPESRWLVTEIARFQPSTIVSVHAPFQVVDYDGPPDPPDKLGSLYLKQMGTYPGSLGRYAGLHLGLPVVTIELPNAGIMPSGAEQLRIWRDLVAWLRLKLPERSQEGLAASLRPGSLNGDGHCPYAAPELAVYGPRLPCR